MKQKLFKIPAENLHQIVKSSLGCIASDMITIEGEKIGYMYREEATETFDSGWRFFSGGESQEYTDNAENFSFFKLNTIANYDLSILPYLEMPIGTSLERNETTGKFDVIKDHGTE